MSTKLPKPLSISAQSLADFALDHIRDAVYLVDAQARYCYANTGASKMLGYTVEEILQLSVSDIAPSFNRQWWTHYWQELKTSGAQARELQHKTKDGHIIQVEILANHVVYDGHDYSLAIVHDITNRKRAEEKLRESEHVFRTLVENSPDAIVRYDKDCRRILTNPAYDKLTQLAPGQVINKKPEEIWPATNMTATEYQDRLRRVMNTGEPDQFLLEWTNTGDQPISIIANVVAEFDADGNFSSILALVRNISEQRQAELQLHQREKYLRTLLDNFPFMVWLKDADSRLLTANTAFAKVAGVANTQALEGRTDFDFFPPDLAEQYLAGDREAMQQDTPIGTVCPIRNANNDYYWIESYKSALIVDGKVVGSVGYARDISEAVMKERELQSLIENSPNTIVRYDSECRRIFINPRVPEIYGVSRESLIGSKPSDIPGGTSSIEYENKIREVFTNGQNCDFDMRWQSADNSQRVINIRLVPEFDAEKQVISVMGVGQDVTASLENEARIQHMAYFDALTNLPNRTLLADRLNQTLAEASRHNQKIALMMLDLDRFKEVNDTMGHAVGDQLLCEVASRLQNCVRAYDTVARFGGDEFAILLPDIRDENDPSQVARKIIANFIAPFEFDGKEIFCSASIGIAIFPTDSSERENLFRYADSALYHTKKQGRNNYQFYSTAMTARASARMDIEVALRKALKKKELELYYQPQVNLSTEKIVGAEALLRWNHNNTVVTPDNFIPIAEDTGLIVDIGEWVIATACKAAVQFNKDQSTPFIVAVNLSTRQFIQNDLVGSIKQILSKTGCSAAWLKLEVTESLLLDNSDAIRKMLQELHNLGLSISIDDFGTGYSALGYLNRFPVSQIKIDRSFVQDITTDRDKASLVQAIISMGQSLRKELVAEGVETREQADFLTRTGCKLAQGYLFGKPMPYAAAHALITAAEA